MDEFYEAPARLSASREVAASKFHIEKFLSSVNKDVLDEVIGEMFKKSELPPSQESVPLAVDYRPGRKASGWHKEGVININSAKFDFNDNLRKNFRRLLSTYVHEYVHASAAGPAEEETGFKYLSPEGRIMHPPINDGFTEIIADYEEYARRTGETARLGQKTPKRTIRGYIEERADAQDIKLLLGKIKGKVNKQNAAQPFVVTTPAAVATVRGTEVDFGFNAEGQLTVDLHNGNIGLVNDAAEMNLDLGGNKLVVHAGGSDRRRCGRRGRLC